LENEKERFLNDLRILTLKFKEIQKFNNYLHVKENSIETTNLKE
jgi:hypothetical protein